MGRLYTDTVPVESFQGRRALTIQSYTEANSKLGYQHEGSLYIPAMTGSSSRDTIFVTGDLPVIIKGRVLGFSGEGISAHMYQDPAYTGGSTVTYQNSSAINPVAGLSNILSGATVTDPGDQIFSPLYLIGNTSRQGQGSTNIVAGGERIFKPNTAYLLRITSLDTQNQRISSYLSWYEGTLDLPLEKGQY